MKAARRPAESRIAAVDCLRGFALGGMIAYHLVWDLHAFGLSRSDPGTSVAWRLVGHCVATMFLALSGFGIALAGRRGFKPRQAALRLGGIAAAAAVVTAATMRVAPGATIWFGILHCIFVTNLVALTLQRRSNTVLITLAVLAALLPWVLPPIFEGAVWTWTGLSEPQPITLDFRPVLPWFCPVLLGMAAGRTRFVDWLARFSLKSSIYERFAWGGRHSLLIYLMHQPVLLGLFVAVYGLPQTSLTPSVVLSDPRQAADFLRTCARECVIGGHDAEICTATCHCVLTAALAHPTLRQALVAPATDSMRAFLAQCRSDP